MSFDGFMLKVSRVSKTYRIYERPIDRLVQILFGEGKGRYCEHEVLNDITFDLKRGETAAIIGRNGSGKSTLLQIIAGTMTQSSGECRVNGRVAALLELGAGFNPEFNGTENARLCMQIYGLSTRQIDERIAEVLAFADIGEYVDRPVSTYSSGMFMRLAFAVIVHVDAEILIIDEALAVGDAFFVQKCMRFLSEFREGGGSLLFVSHDMGAVKSLCDRAIWLDGGRIVADADPDSVSKKYLESMYTGKLPDAAEGGSVAALESKRESAPAPDLVQSQSMGSVSSVSITQNHAPRDGFGEGGARILRVTILDTEKRITMDFSGGEVVTLRVEFAVDEPMARIIVGFFVKDKRGQALFGDNTYLACKDRSISADVGDTWAAEFEFSMPILPAGEYVITVAVAEGSQENHRIRHWLHDALIVVSHSRVIPTGLVGIPMREIRLGPSAELGMS